MHVTVDDNVCMGHALCHATGPDVYDLDERGHCDLLETAVPDDLEDQAVQGADACPERAITVSL